MSFRSSCSCAVKSIGVGAVVAAVEADEGFVLEVVLGVEDGASRPLRVMFRR